MPPITNGRPASPVTGAPGRRSGGTAFTKTWLPAASVLFAAKGLVMVRAVSFRPTIIVPAVVVKPAGAFGFQSSTPPACTPTAAMISKAASDDENGEEGRRILGMIKKIW